MRQLFTYFTQIIKYISSIIFVICLGFFLIAISVPLYNKGPETNLFQNTRITKYIIVGENTGLQLDIINNNTNQTNTIISKDTNQIIYPADNIETTFNFPNKELSGKNNFFIQFPNQTTIALYPGTTIKFKKDNQNIIIQKQSGILEYFLPDNNQNITIQSGKQIQYNDFIGKELLVSYDKAKDKYIVNQLGGNIMLNPQINKIRKTVLDILYMIRPQKYQTNQDNYKEFQKLLKRKESKQTIYINNQKEIQNNIFDQIKKGFSQTQLAN